MGGLAGGGTPAGAPRPPGRGDRAGAPAAAIPTVNHATYRELVRLGTNLNQIAHHLNSGNVVTPDLGRRLSGELAHVAEQVRRLRLELTTAR